MPLFLPKLVTVLREGIPGKQLIRDSIAGVVLGIIALPLSIAFAIASGVEPSRGIFTAIVGGFVISMLSGSRVQIGGPTGAFIVIIYDIIQRYGYDGLVISTIIAGLILIFFGIIRMGDIIKYIPYPVTVGFTSGIAVIIFSSQIKDFFGFKNMTMPGSLQGKWETLINMIPNLSLPTLGIGILSLLIIIVWPRNWIYFPGYLAAIIIATCVTHIFGLSVETVYNRFGQIHGTIPQFQIPSIHFSELRYLFSPALTIAFLAGIESLLSAVIADGMTNRRHRSNTELIGQGIANILSPLFGGIPVTGAIARTAMNIRLGGKTPIAGMVHGIVLMIIFLFMGQLISMVPMASFAGILIIIAVKMSEYRLFLKLFKAPKSDIAVLLITFSLTIFTDLTTAIEVGVLLAALLFMKRMVDVTKVGFIKSIEDSHRDITVELVLPKGIEIFEIYGPFFFGAADKFRNVVRQIEKPPKVLILRMRHVPVMDATGLHALEDLFTRCRKDNIQLILSGVQKQPHKILNQTKMIHKIREENIFSNINQAVQKAKEYLKEEA